GEVIFTFDGDAAGRAAALKAFGEDQVFAAQTFVAVERSGLDPCELRQQRGPDAVHALVAGRTPLFEFVLRSTLEQHDLDTAEGRVAALRAAAPVVAGIRDAALRAEYTRLLDGWLGMDDLRAVRAAVGGAGKRRSADQRAEAPRPVARPDHRDPVASLERTALEAVLQRPDLVPEQFDELASDTFAAPAHRAVHEAVRAAGGVATGHGLDAAAWVAAVAEEAAEPVRSLVTELAVAPMPADREEAMAEYVRGVTNRLVEIGFTRRIADLRGRLQRTAPSDPEYGPVFAELVAVEGRRRLLRESV
ncbi:MAG: DNA primase, partial [Cellulomonas sp.]|nr:DNA primase [Cellulomonas sp.]